MGSYEMIGMAEIRAEHDPQEDVAPDFDEETETYLLEIAPEDEGDG